jgi:hypothetical protein
VPVARDGSGVYFWGVRSPSRSPVGDPTEKEHAMSTRKHPAGARPRELRDVKAD